MILCQYVISIQYEIQCNSADKSSNNIEIWKQGYVWLDAVYNYLLPHFLDVRLITRNFCEN